MAIGAYGIQAMAYGMWSVTIVEQGQSLAQRKKKQSNDGIEEREKRMSREEAIEILSDMRAEYNIFGDEEEATRYHVLSWAIQEMKAAQQWIPVSERLPEGTQTVLTTFIEDGVAKVDTLNYFGEPLGWTDFRYVEELGRPKSYEVTAWMPLPEPWKGEEE